jgi:hypothetical protein
LCLLTDMTYWYYTCELPGRVLGVHVYEVDESGTSTTFIESLDSEQALADLEWWQWAFLWRHPVTYMCSCGAGFQSWDEALEHLGANGAGRVT